MLEDSGRIFWEDQARLFPEGLQPELYSFTAVDACVHACLRPLPVTCLCVLQANAVISDEGEPADGDDFGYTNELRELAQLDEFREEDLPTPDDLQLISDYMTSAEDYLAEVSIDGGWGAGSGAGRCTEEI